VAAARSPNRYTPLPDSPAQVPDTLMTVIALVLAGNILLAGLFSLVAVAFD
jgi:hypothetical protein